MAAFRARQVATIRDAVAAGRQAVRQAARPDRITFARAYVEAGGAQVPGDRAGAPSRALGERLLAAVAGGQDQAADDPDLERELRRVATETEWARALDDERVIGFLIEFPDAALETPTVEALAHQSQGLGPGIVRKADILVLQPECDGVRFIPVTEHDIEC